MQNTIKHRIVKLNLFELINRYNYVFISATYFLICIWLNIVFTSYAKTINNELLRNNKLLITNPQTPFNYLPRNNELISNLNICQFCNIFFVFCSLCVLLQPNNLNHINGLNINNKSTLVYSIIFFNFIVKSFLSLSQIDLMEENKNEKLVPFMQIAITLTYIMNISFGLIPIGFMIVFIIVSIIVACCNYIGPFVIKYAKKITFNIEETYEINTDKNDV